MQTQFFPMTLDEMSSFLTYNQTHEVWLFNTDSQTLPRVKRGLSLGIRFRDQDGYENDYLLHEVDWIRGDDLVPLGLVIKEGCVVCGGTKIFRGLCSRCHFEAYTEDLPF